MTLDTRRSPHAQTDRLPTIGDDFDADVALDACDDDEDDVTPAWARASVADSVAHYRFALPGQPG